MFYYMSFSIWVRDVGLRVMMWLRGFGCRIRAVGPRPAWGGGLRV